MDLVNHFLSLHSLVRQSNFFFGLLILWFLVIFIFFFFHQSLQEFLSSNTVQGLCILFDPKLRTIYFSSFLLYNEHRLFRILNFKFILFLIILPNRNVFICNKCLVDINKLKINDFQITSFTIIRHYCFIDKLLLKDFSSFVS